MHKLMITLAIVSLTLLAQAAMAAPAAGNYFQGWEDPAWTGGSPDWADGVTRVASGTNGITASDGSGYAIAQGADGPYTKNGGYSAQWGGGWTERLDIYMDVDKAADTSYWWSLTTALDKNVGGSAAHLQDNIFMCAGTGTAGQFTIGARNTDEGVKNAAWIATYAAGQSLLLTQSQWITLEWNFFEDGTAQKLAYNVFDQSGSLLYTLAGSSHDLADSDGLGNPIGGNRYTWFINVKDHNGNAQLAIDNSSTTYVPEPITMTLMSLGGLAALMRRRRTA